MQPLDHDQTTSVPTALQCLHPLVPTSLLPEKYSRHMCILAKLKQIRAVHATTSSIRGDKRSYVLEVYTSPQSPTRIPTSLERDATMCAAACYEEATRRADVSPDVHIEKTFADFVTLRTSLFDCSLESHPLTRCEFCNDVSRYFLLGVSQPGTLLGWALPQKQRAHAVDQFIKAILRFAILCPVNVSETCRCQEQVPKQLYKFLFESSDEGTF